MKENYNFQVDLQGIIRLLSDNLYSSKDVFLREVLQNAIDAITARKEQQPEFSEGKVSVSYIENPGKVKSAELIFKDNGIGLTKEEIHSFLAVIGRSSKRSDEVRNSFWGQFGIGLLSCFLVTDEIKVYTRSLKEEKGYQWLGYSDGTYKVSERKAKMEVGTEIHIQLKGEKYRLYKPEKIVNMLREYGFLITVPIYFQKEEQQEQVNDAFIPWRKSFCTSEEIIEFGEQLFGESFFDVIPLNGEDMKGYAFISMKQATASSTNAHKIYLKNMFVTEDGKDLIPKWAFFTRCILNVKNLTPTAAREGFLKDHKLAKVQNEIEKSIFDYFVSLAEYDVRKLKQITRVHNVAIKSLAVENEKVYKFFFPFLTFVTNKGEMTGFQILEAARKMKVCYCMEVDEFRRVSPLVEENNRLLINAGYIYDGKLLQMLKKYNKEVKIEMFDEMSYENFLETPEDEVVFTMENLLHTAKMSLKEYSCDVVLKNFSPQQLPAIYVPTGEINLEEAMDMESFSSFFEGFSFEMEEESYSAKLYLNCTNQLIKRLAMVQNMEVIDTIIKVIYIQAITTGHYTLGQQEIAIMNDSLTKLMEFGMDSCL